MRHLRKGTWDSAIINIHDDSTTINMNYILNCDDIVDVFLFYVRCLIQHGCRCRTKKELRKDFPASMVSVGPPQYWPRFKKG